LSFFCIGAAEMNLSGRALETHQNRFFRQFENPYIKCRSNA
jgi:hypothetical protein